MIDFVKISKVINPEDLLFDSLDCISRGRTWMRLYLSSRET